MSAFVVCCGWLIVKTRSKLLRFIVTRFRRKTSVTPRIGLWFPSTMSNSTLCRLPVAGLVTKRCAVPQDFSAVPFHISNVLAGPSFMFVVSTYFTGRRLVEAPVSSRKFTGFPCTISLAWYSLASWTEWIMPTEFSVREFIVVTGCLQIAYSVRCRLCPSTLCRSGSGTTFPGRNGWVDHRSCRFGPRLGTVILREGGLIHRTCIQVEVQQRMRLVYGCRKSCLVLSVLDP